MGKCPKCGNVLKSDQKFCIKCGSKIDDLKKIKLTPEILAQIDILQKKISNDNLNSLLYIKLGDIYFENEMHNEAILEFQKSFTIDNKNFDSIFKTAEAYRKIKEFTKAEPLYQKALEIDPKSQEAKLGLFWCYYFQNKIEDLINLEKEINDDIKKLDFLEAMKEAFKKTDNPESAFEEMEKIFKLVPENIDNLRDLAEYYYDRDDYNKSIEFYKKILLIDPNDIDSIFVIGKDYCYKKDYNKTIELFESNLTNFPDELVSLIYFYLSYSYLKLENTYKAIEMIQNVDSPNIKSISSRDREIVAKTFFVLSDNFNNNNNLQSSISYLENAIEFDHGNQKFIDRLNEAKQLNTDKQKRIKKKKLKKINLSIFLIIITSLLIFSITKFLNIREDNLAWRSALNINTINSYQKYIHDYPVGKNIEEAYIKEEEAIWNNSESVNSHSSYEEYLQKYPEGKFIDNAIVRAESLNWINCSETNSLSSFINYFHKYPYGIHISDVKKLHNLYLKNNNLIYVQGGTFQMGSNDGSPDEKPIHSVTVSDFYIGQYEITQKEWKALMGSNPSNWKGDKLPVEHVGWRLAAEFCNKKSENEGLQKCYSGSGRNITCNFNANGYRLPTEAEWEYAARGGNKSKGYKYSGSNNIGHVAWYKSNSNHKPHPVGGKQPNELGIYDMSGNVLEYCNDYYGSDYYSKSTDKNPRGSSSRSFHSVRGGSWYCDANRCRVAYREDGNGWSKNTTRGFRLVRSSK